MQERPIHYLMRSPTTPPYKTTPVGSPLNESYLETLEAELHLIKGNQGGHHGGDILGAHGYSLAILKEYRQRPTPI